MTMETVYIIMCQKGKNDPKNYIFASSVPYAVFNNKHDAECMKREGDYIVEVPYIHNPHTLRPVKIDDCIWPDGLRSV